MSVSVFSEIKAAPPVPVFAISAAATADPHPNKVNLSVGAYRNDQGKPWVLPIVRTVELQLAEDETLNKEYLPITGLPEYGKATLNLLLGSQCAESVKNRADAIQCLGGTGAIRLGCDFLKRVANYDSLLVSNPTWENHVGIALQSGFSHVSEYRYWQAATRTIDIEGMLEDLRNAPDRSVVVLHGVAHNPTGCDPTDEQWHQILEVIRAKRHFPFIDLAYQGFASGDLDADARLPRMLVKTGYEMFVAQSFSKNFGLYNERVGALAIVLHSPEALANVLSQCRLLVRQTWSNPPSHGARVVATVLNNPALFNEWKASVVTMADRIKQMRKLLHDRLRTLGTPGTWTHLVTQCGMFSYTGLSPNQVEYLKNTHHIYMMPSGRMNVCGITTQNVDYMANAIHDTVVNCPI